MKIKKQRRRIIIKYGIVFILTFVVFVALIALREFLLMISFLVQWLIIALPAAAFREAIHMNCSICQSI